VYRKDGEWIEACVLCLGVSFYKVLSLWGYMKVTVYVPALPQDINCLKYYIRRTVAKIERRMLQNIWQEITVVLMCAEQCVVRTLNLVSKVKKAELLLLIM
jgi:hypothetical protein